MSSKRSKMKPVHTDFIDLVDLRIKPILKKKGRQDSFTEGTKELADFLGGIDLDQTIGQPSVILFAKRRKKK